MVVLRAAAAMLAVLLPQVAGGADLNGPMSSTRPDGSTGASEPFEVKKLFANTCGWCHQNGGREAGRGPQLMGTRLSDAEIVTRIRFGKQGAMPAFGSAFDDAQIQAIVRYIRELKPEGAAQ